METMSQFFNESELWKARCLRFASALVGIMVNINDSEIQAETGFPIDACDKISQARADALKIIKEGK